MKPETLFKLSYGVYIVSSISGEKINGQIANSMIQVTAEPPTIAVSINRNNLTHEFITKSKKLSISILSQSAPMTLIGQFGFKSGRDLDKFKGINYKMGTTGVPVVLDNCVGSLEAEVIDQIEVGTHTVFIAKVLDADVLSNDPVMTYAYYHTIKGGKSPKSAPTYIKEEKTGTGDKAMQKYVCKVCGYVYDPALGDPDNGIKPGTSFEAIPETWVCPLCGADKSQFEAQA